MKEMPKYKIIENYIIDRIQSGDLKPGDQIETEKQLSEKFDIGRLTVNKSLINLAQEGYIERTAGKGSFVLPRMVTKSISQGGSFTDDMASVGMKAGSQLIEYKVYKAADVPEAVSYTHLDVYKRQADGQRWNCRSASDLPVTGRIFKQITFILLPVMI